jgi:MFS family permease
MTPARESRAPGANYKWAVVGMLWFVCFFNYADRQAISGVFPALIKEYGFDKVQVGIIGSAFMWVYALGAPFAGYIGDRVQRRHLILGGCLFWSAVTVLTGKCTQFWHFVTVRALEGFGETFYFPASMSLVSDYHDKRTRSKAFSIHQSSVYVGTIGGSWAGAWFAEHYGWRTGFYFFGISGAILALVLYRFLREPRRGAADAALSQVDLGPPPTWREALKIIFRTRTALMLMLVFIGANYVATIFLMWTPTFLVEKFDFRLTQAGLSGAVFIHLASAASVPFGGILADRWANRFAGGRMAVQALGLLVGATFVAIVGLTADKTTLLLSMVVFGICKGFYDANIFASLYDVIEPRARATAAGVMNTVGWTGGALGPVVVGLISKYGRHEREIDNMSEAIALGSVVYLIGAVLLAVAIFRFAKNDRVA